MGILIQSKSICSDLLVSLLSPPMLLLLIMVDIMVVMATVVPAAPAMEATEVDISIVTMELPHTPLALWATPSLPPAAPISALRRDSAALVLVKDLDLSVQALDPELVASKLELAKLPRLALPRTADPTNTKDPRLISDSGPPSPSSASTAPVAGLASIRLVLSIRQELELSA